MMNIKPSKNFQEMVISAVTDYFKPIFFVMEKMDKSFSLEEKNRELEHKLKEDKNEVNVISRAICVNQGSYLQYTFLAAEKHRKLKDTFRENKSNVLEIKRLANELTSHVNGKFYEAVLENFKLLHAYFHKRKKEQPRICIKGNFKISNKDNVVSVFRDTLVGYDSDSEIEKNYGFFSVFKNGTYYLENDIPKAVLNKRYFNPRLDIDKAESILKDKKDISNREWKECWIGDKKSNTSFYKSTLIIPMTLWNNKLSTEFKDLIRLENVDRTIFGFLCFDHVDKDFFDEKRDVSVGYVFADLLSMYIFTRLIYMEISRTFEDVEKFLVEREIDIDGDTLADIWKKIPSLKNFDMDLRAVYKKTQLNDLYSLDSDLLKYSRAVFSREAESQSEIN